jgi:SAM-dependent methyltransferase
MADAVAAQYEAYPYPARDPKDERFRLVTGSPSHLDELDHMVFGGRLDRGRPFRALFAGGGTGDGLIMLAQLCADAGVAAEITYLDLSAAARRIAEERARVRGLRSIRFLSGSLLEVASLAPGPYDYIDCCGVLHHLEAPEAGIAALASVLAPGGGMGLMLYAPYGRSGVYELQAALRLLGRGLDAQRRLVLAKRLLPGLPDTNRFRRNTQLSDHRQSDAGLYDLLLHSRDRAYTVGEIAALLAGAGLRIAGFAMPVRYDPATYLADPKLRAALGGLDPVERAEVAEALAGNMRTHVLYAVPAASAAAPAGPPFAPEDVPVLRDRDGPALAKGLKPGTPLAADIDGLTLRLPLPPLAGPMLAEIDGSRSLGAIMASVAESRGRPADWPAFAAQFGGLFETLGGLGRLFLRRPPC